MPKPMNCPGHMQVFSSKPRSYRDLPIRFADSTVPVRLAGSSTGCSRSVRDPGRRAHFCTQEQVEAEIDGCIELEKEPMRTSGSRRTPAVDAPGESLGTDDEGDHAEVFRRSRSSVTGSTT